MIGLCAAYECTARGWRVTVVERHGEQRDGCSYENTGMIVPSHFVPLAAPGMVALALRWMWNPASPFYLKPRFSWELFDWAFRFWRAANLAQARRAGVLLRDLALASRERYRELAKTLEGFEFSERGLLALCASAHALEEEAGTARLARELGIDAEVLDAEQTAAREPGMRMAVAGSVWYPQDGNLVPDRLMDALQRRLDAAGVTFAWNSEAAGWRAEGGTIRALVMRDGAEIAGDEFVLCAGAWSAQLARPLGLHLPLQAGKGYSLTLARPRRVPQRCALLVEARVAVSPIDGALRFGGTMELAGLNEDVSDVRVRGIVAAARRYYPDLAPEEFAGVRPWRGLRPCSPDGLPYLGRSRRCANLIVATGHAMLGVTLAPITALLCAEIVAGERPRLEISLLSPDRFD